MANQPFGAKVLEVTVPQIGGPVSAVPEVVDGNDAKGTDGGQCPDLGTSQIVVFIAH
jgi:hypothetical protein